MKAAALAESYYGVGKAYQDFVYVGITHGIGAAVIAGGKLLAGNRGFSGELGHTTLYPNGEQCVCGNIGCAELYLSVPKVLEQAGLSSWDDFVFTPNTPAMQRFLSDLGILLTGVVNLFDPEAVVLGHEGALLSQKCYQTLQQILDKRTMTRQFKTVHIIPSALAQSITAQSGGALVFDRLFGGEFKL
jgi:predicted NBD/HSP70 family sugar kinase